MTRDNVILEKTYNFSIRIVKLYKYMVSNQNEFTLSKQILRSGTSIGANVEEAIGGITKKDFISKLTISYKEARETHYWLRLLKDTGYMDIDKHESLAQDCEEILRILYSIIRSSKQNL